MLKIGSIIHRYINILILKMSKIKVPLAYQLDISVNI